MARTRKKFMFFLFFSMTLVIASIAVVYKTLTGYAEFSALSKLVVFLVLTASWFSPLLLHLIRRGPEFLNGTFYDIAYKLGYFMMGFVLLLTMLILCRDILWHIVYFVSRKPLLNPNNAHNINVLNVVTILLAFAASFYGVYEAHKAPVVKELSFKESRVKKPIRFVIASDFHINQSTPEWHIKKMINAINAQNPDYILLVGDIIDDEPEHTLNKFQLLKELKAKKIYVSLGNHEYYRKPYAWMIEFSKIGFEVLQNSGEKIEDAGVFVAGIPDVGTTNVNYTRAFEGASDEYKILMSHSPTNFKDLDKRLFDIQFSGHTHGGQIFPFQYITRKANDGYLAGLYTTEGAKLFVSKGAGYWGPPMRIFSEPDIVVLNLGPKQ